MCLVWLASAWMLMSPFDHMPETTCPPLTTVLKLDAWSWTAGHARAARDLEAYESERHDTDTEAQILPLQARACALQLRL